jgi:hypothetical protein
MMTNDLFQKWAKKSETPKFAPSVKKAVVYTRVSSKEQYDKNLSLVGREKPLRNLQAEMVLKL